MRNLFLSGLVLAAAAAVSTAGPINLGNFGLSASATFLEQYQGPPFGDNCVSGYGAPVGCSASMFAPLILNLTSLGVNPGDTLQLTSVGSICYGAFGTNCGAASLEALFSSTNNLLDSSNLNRVTGALGPPSVASGTLVTPTTSVWANGASVSNDISQDFAANGVSVIVPNGALFLFIGVSDSYWVDNSGNSSINLVDTAPVATPEPGTYVLALAGLAGLLALRKVRA